MKEDFTFMTKDLQMNVEVRTLSGGAHSAMTEMDRSQMRAEFSEKIRETKALENIQLQIDNFLTANPEKKS